MTVVAEGIGFRAAGIAGATFTTADLARARVFYLARLGFPLLHDEKDAFTFGAGTSTITVRREVDEPMAPDAPRPRQPSLERISLWCAGLDDLRSVAEALTAAGIEHSRAPVPRFGTDGVAFRDPDGIEWELRVR
jgi:catechol 2,3-dioxygenase-like lactoylglutathione lyase family enzyme